MALYAEAWSLSAACVGLLLVFLSTAPAAKGIFNRLARTSTHAHQDVLHSQKSHYADEDGEATEVSLKQFSDKRQRVAIAILSVTGFEICLGLAIITTVHAGIEHYLFQSWIQVAVWVSLTLEPTITSSKSEH